MIVSVVDFFPTVFRRCVVEKYLLHFYTAFYHIFYHIFGRRLTNNASFFTDAKIFFVVTGTCEVRITSLALFVAPFKVPRVYSYRVMSVCQCLYYKGKITK